MPCPAAYRAGWLGAGGCTPGSRGSSRQGRGAGAGGKPRPLRRPAGIRGMGSHRRVTYLQTPFTPSTHPPNSVQRRTLVGGVGGLRREVSAVMSPASTALWMALRRSVVRDAGFEVGITLSRRVHDGTWVASARTCQTPGPPRPPTIQRTGARHPPSYQSRRRDPCRWITPARKCAAMPKITRACKSERKLGLVPVMWVKDVAARRARAHPASMWQHVGVGEGRAGAGRPTRIGSLCRRMDTHLFSTSVRGVHARRRFH